MIVIKLSIGKVTLNPGGNFDIGGSTIQDSLGDNIGEYIDGSFKCSPSIEGLTWESLTTGNFQVPAGCDKEYKMTYQTKFGEDPSNAPAITKSNTFTINLLVIHKTRIIQIHLK